MKLFTRIKTCLPENFNPRPLEKRHERSRAGGIDLPHRSAMKEKGGKTDNINREKKWREILKKRENINVIVLFSFIAS